MDNKWQRKRERFIKRLAQGRQRAQKILICLKTAQPPSSHFLFYTLLYLSLTFSFLYLYLVLRLPFFYPPSDIFFYNEGTSETAIDRHTDRLFNSRTDITTCRCRQSDSGRNRQTGGKKLEREERSLRAMRLFL